jgi:hypothetical protein
VVVIRAMRQISKWIERANYGQGDGTVAVRGWTDGACVHAVSFQEVLDAEKIHPLSFSNIPIMCMYSTDNTKSSLSSD